ncbi:MAG: hypothetical protein LBE30_16730 [Comamonas sp.]|jgi:hypothetical protein|nr:hypothetical protein [Comamonas sp.]
MQTAADFIAALDVDESVKAVQLEAVSRALMPWLQHAPAAEVRQLAQALLAGNTRWHVTLHDTLSWLADEDWPELVAVALQSAQARGSMSNAERAVLEAASYQQPELIKPLIASLAELDFDVEQFEAETQVQIAQAAMHLIFPPRYLDRTIAWIPRHWHPSWNLQPGSERYRFGGAGVGHCQRCGGPLQHLISLPASKVFGGDRPADKTVHLQLCLSCMESGIGELHYRHDEAGQAHCLNAAQDGLQQEPEREYGPLRATEVALAETPARWQRQDWGQSNGRENLYRVGGEPAWIQSPWEPLCTCCGQTMHFVLQLDSQIPQAEGGDAHCWGSGGMLYGFACTPCAHSAYITQYT